MVAMAGRSMPGRVFQHIAGNRHQRAGVARTNPCLRIARLDEVRHDAHRRIFFLAHGKRGRIIHTHHFTGVVNDESVAEGDASLIELLFDLSRHPDQNHASCVIMTQ